MKVMKRNQQFINSCLASFLLLIFSHASHSQSTAISSDGVKICFDTKGTGDPALIFVHGWGNNRSAWDGQVAYFSPKYTIVTIDLAGFGESGNNREKWDIASFGKDVVAVIDKLQLNKVVLIGHSMGGPVVIEAAKIIPGKVIGLVIEDALHDVDFKYSVQTINYIDSVLMDLATAPTMEKAKIVLNFEGDVPPESEEFLKKKIFSMFEGHTKTGWSESLKDNFRWANEDCIESIKAIPIPIVSINNDQPPTNIEAFRKYHPAFEAKIIPKSSHGVHFVAPEKFNFLLEESIQEFINAAKE